MLNCFHSFEVLIFFFLASRLTNNFGIIFGQWDLYNFVFNYNHFIQIHPIYLFFQEVLPRKRLFYFNKSVALRNVLRL